MSARARSAPTLVRLAVALGAAALVAVAIGADDAPKKPASDPYPLATCPVSGRPLGEGAVAMEVDGRAFRFCCDQCPERFKADPAKYLPAVDAKIVEMQKPVYPLKTCLVMPGDELVEGEAVDLVWNNRLVRVCCKSCARKFSNDPGKWLPKLDAAVIEAQKDAYPLEVCVVSGEKLGGMGEPVNMVVNNRLVRLCCAGCERAVRKDPAAAFAKIDAAKKPG